MKKPALIRKTLSVWILPGLMYLGLNAAPQDGVFTEDSTMTEALIQAGAAKTCWGDLNHDAFPDLVLSGGSASEGYFTVIYLTDGTGLLGESQNFPIGCGPFGTVEPGDYNNDGDLDILVCGHNVALLKNRGGVFSMVDPGAAIPDHFDYSTGRWGDVDADGDLDLLVMGVDTLQGYLMTGLFRNHPLGTLTIDPTQILARIANGDAAWGDYDQDGDLDLVMAGQSAATNSNVIKVYKNEPTGRLIEDTNQQLTLIGLKAASTAWIDYDGDGDPDLIATGWAGDTTGLSVTTFYENEPVGTLTRLTNPAQTIAFGTGYGSLDFGDYDNDGDLDLIVAGADTVSADGETILTAKAKIFQNSGSESYILSQTITGGRNVNFIDYDGDGDLDLLVAGFTDMADSTSGFTKIYRNDGVSPGNPPDFPASQSAFAIGNQVILSWTEGTDPETPTTALSYNLRLGTAANPDTVLSGAGPYGKTNVGQSLVRVFHDIPPGAYQWEVQTLDQSLGRSPWSEPDSLFIPRLVESFQALTGLWYATASWNDYDGDGNLDLVLSGNSFDLGGAATRVFHNDSGEILSPDLSQDIQAVWGGSMAWGDVDNDDYLDFILAGMDGLTPVASLYRWDSGSGRFELVETPGLPQVWGGSQIVDWADYDNDGDLDLALGGCLDKDCLTASGLLIYQNNSGLFARDSLQPVIPFRTGSLAWVDFNSDGFVDLFTAGFDSASTSAIRIYRNDRSGRLTEFLTIPDEGVASGSADWGDFDSDGFPDLALTGLYPDGDIRLKIFGNDGGLTLTEIGSASGVFYGFLNWGDYDVDGRLDLVMSGYADVPVEPNSIGSNPITRVFRNTGSGLAEEDSLGLAEAGTSTVIWGDYDGDGDLDLLVAGVSGSGHEFSKVYDNLESTRNPNLPPAAPYGLSEAIDTTRVILSWIAPPDQGPSASQTPSQALTYNLEVGTSPLGHDIVSGTRTYGFGACGNPDSLTLRGLTDGRYYWRVQAVDNGFARSAWSESRSFYFDVAPPRIDTVMAAIGTGGQINLVVRFLEANGMDNTVSPVVLVGPAFAGDTVAALEQSYSGNVWTGVVTLEDRLDGNAIRISISGARDQAGYILRPVTVFRTPAKVISTRGGLIISADGRVTLQVSPNAVAEDVEINISRLSAPLVTAAGAVPVGPGYRIRPLDLALDKPAILSMSVTAGDFAQASLMVDPDSLYIGAILPGDSLVWIGGTVSEDQSSYRITTAVNELGSYAVFYGTPPIASQVWSRTVTCQPRIFSPGGSTFAARTTILFDLEKSGPVSVRIFNPAGRFIATVADDQPLPAGRNAIAWDGRDRRGKLVASGLYIITVETESKTLAATVGVLNK